VTRKKENNCSPSLDLCFCLSSQEVSKQTNKQKTATNTNRKVAQTLLSSFNQALFGFYFQSQPYLNWWERADRYINAYFHLNALQLASFFLLAVI